MVISIQSLMVAHHTRPSANLDNVPSAVSSKLAQSLNNISTLANLDYLPEAFYLSWLESLMIVRHMRPLANHSSTAFN